MLDTYSIVNLLPLNIRDEENIAAIAASLDAAMNYADYAEVKDAYRNFGDDDE